MTEKDFKQIFPLGEKNDAYSFDYDLPIAEKQSAFLFPSNTFCVCSYHFIYHSSIKNDR